MRLLSSRAQLVVVRVSHNPNRPFRSLHGCGSLEWPWKWLLCFASRSGPLMSFFGLWMCVKFRDGSLNNVSSNIERILGRYGSYPGRGIHKFGFVIFLLLDVESWLLNLMRNIRKFTLFQVSHPWIWCITNHYHNNLQSFDVYSRPISISIPCVAVKPGPDTCTSSLTRSIHQPRARLFQIETKWFMP